MAQEAQVIRQVDEVRQEMRQYLNQREDRLRAQYEAGEIDAGTFNQQLRSLTTRKTALDGVAGALTAPGGFAGAMVGASSPMVDQAIKTHSEPGSTGNILAHGAWGAVQTLAGGNGSDALRTAVATGAAEYTAPLIAQAVYGTSNPRKLNATQKNNLNVLLGTAATGIGASGGNGLTGAMAGRAVDSALNSNFLGSKTRERQDQIYSEAKKYPNLDDFFKFYPNKAQEYVQNADDDKKSDELVKKRNVTRQLDPYERNQLAEYYEKAAGEYLSVYQKSGKTDKNSERTGIYFLEEARRIRNGVLPPEKSIYGIYPIHSEDEVYRAAYKEKYSSVFKYRNPVEQVSNNLTLIAPLALVETKPVMLLGAFTGGYEFGTASREAYEGNWDRMINFTRETLINFTLGAATKRIFSSNHYTSGGEEIFPNAIACSYNPKKQRLLDKVMILPVCLVVVT